MSIKTHLIYSHRSIQTPIVWPFYFPMIYHFYEFYLCAYVLIVTSLHEDERLHVLLTG